MVVEALGAIQAVIFNCELGFHDIILKGDALWVVNAAKMKGKNMSSFGHIVEGIKEGMHFLRSSCIVHTRWDANSAAHALVKEVVQHVIDKVWIEDCPHSLWYCNKGASSSFF